MASVLIIGGDRLGRIVDLLQGNGFQEINHITGRKASQVKVKIPVNTNMILVLTDFVNHNLSTSIKLKAKEQNLPIMFCKRSISELVKVLPPKLLA
ncbi:UNVERIFIED_CONTAM: hypothetical protein ABID98_000006 [Brevibacillus sp. OAP136]